MTGTRQIALQLLAVLAVLSALAMSAVCSGCGDSFESEGDDALGSDATAQADAPDDGAGTDIGGTDGVGFDVEGLDGFVVGDVSFPDPKNNQAPTVLWQQSAPDTVVQLGAAVTLSAMVGDDQTDLEMLAVSLTAAPGPQPSVPAIWATADGTVTVVIDDLPAGQQTLTFEVSDGMGGTASASREIFVNTPPGAPTLIIEPAMPNTTDDLTAVLAAPASDVDRTLDEATAYTWQWRLDGAVVADLTGTTVPAARTDAGDTWQVRAFANDGQSDGPVAMTTVVIANTAPGAPTVAVEPDPADVASVLLCVVQVAAVDIDDDEVSYGWSWTVNGAPLPQPVTTATLALAAIVDGAWQQVVPVHAGDTVTCVATATDGKAIGPPAEASVTLAAFDACLLGASGCGSNASCTPGDTVVPTCACEAGFDGDGATCADLDECSAEVSPCAKPGFCENTAGSYVCVCPDGLASAPDGCTDIDECANGEAGCDPNAQCSNTDGSFVCTCDDGYVGDGATCDDLDECATLPGACDLAQDCSNTVGSYDCVCKDGYADSDGDCVDVDECETGAAACDLAAQCTNTIGSFTCTCNDGYEGDGQICVDVDECKAGTADCDPHATCSNDVGGYLCQCDIGYIGDGLACDDVDECQTGAAECDLAAECTNTVGSYDCTCKPGFEGDGQICVDVDECVTGEAVCGANAGCVNADGDYMCQCALGYVGDGKICDDVDECALGVAECHAAAICANTDGDYTCTCKPDWAGDGKTCAPQ